MDRDAPSQAMRRLRRVGEVALWLLVIGFALITTAKVLGDVLVVVVPLGLGIVVTTILQPPAWWLRGRGVPDALAAFVVLLAALLVVGGIVALLTPQAVDQFDQLDVSISEGLGEIQDWLVDGPLSLSAEQVDNVVGELRRAVEDSAGEIGSRIVTGAFVVLEILAALVLTIVITFFLLKDGDRIWAWICELAPVDHRDDVRELGSRSWAALSGFVRAQAFVAAFDATFIGLALVVLSVPLVVPLATLTFFGAFVPIVGAVLTGAAAVLVALVSEGLGTALLVLAAVIAVQQLEGNVLQPVLVGRTVHVHPLVILLAVSAGIAVAGIIGGLVAAPIVAAAAAVLGYLRERADAGQRPAAEIALPGGGTAAREAEELDEDRAAS